MRSLLILPLSALVLSGCFQAKVKPITTAEGAAGYSIACSGELLDWQDCYTKAGEICGPKGYSEQTKNKGRNYERSLIIACKK